MLRCMICHTLIRDGEETRECPECRETFHEACWTDLGGCASYGCGQATVAEKGPPARRLRTTWGDTKKCPSCGRSLIVQRECPEGCGDDCIVLTLPGDNKIFVCARLGCPAHHLHIAEMPESIIAQVDDINLSHEGVRDVNYFSPPDDDTFRGI